MHKVCMYFEIYMSIYFNINIIYFILYFGIHKIILIIFTIIVNLHNIILRSMFLMYVCTSTYIYIYI